VIVTSIPVESDVRTRLREAQAAEAAALRTVQRAQDARSKQQQRVDAAQAKVDDAMAALVRVSGAQRAARLAGDPVNAVRRMARRAGLAPNEIQ
jgi:hypothetical protein